ncbi:hypothetical protein KXQ82_12890 [Mucilaginibacter sp. HMF5004]|uniref:tetratricopeptide repeat protein n=1 Tax=Mucilaginibacter rivuli TaxID=2857527 RepID=UPI001C5D0A01|nr:hypothetical protein [Mucilaginibacter rivuli]MBW4890624.1 hypothetical protein [Mucilaginibacter rivuli]
MRSVFVFMLLSGFCLCASAQTVYDKYVDFNDAIIQHHPDKAMELGTGILTGNEKLPAKTQTKFYAFMAKLYEDSKQPDNAIKYYELVVLAEPDYYIAHRALGYLYLDKAKVALLSSNYEIAIQHNKWLKLAIPHLEKDEACNPDKEGLDMIKKLYGSLNDKEGLKTLDTRLKQMGAGCVDLLTD